MRPVYEPGGKYPPSIRDFYWARTLKIVPSYFIDLGITAALSFSRFSPLGFRRIVLAHVLFAQNTGTQPGYRQYAFQCCMAYESVTRELPAYLALVASGMPASMALPALEQMPCRALRVLRASPTTFRTHDIFSSRRKRICNTYRRCWASSTNSSFTCRC
jgi:hypothetical protein